MPNNVGDGGDVAREDRREQRDAGHVLGAVAGEARRVLTGSQNFVVDGSHSNPGGSPGAEPLAHVALLQTRLRRELASVGVGVGVEASIRSVR